MCKRVERLLGAIVNWYLDSHATLATWLDVNGYLGDEVGIIYSSLYTAGTDDMMSTLRLR